MGITPVDTISKHGGRRIIIDRSTWTGSAGTCNSVLCNIPFTGYKLIWFDKALPNHGRGMKMIDRFHIDKVRRVRYLAGLIPILHEIYEDPYITSSQKQILSEEDWEYISDKPSYLAFYTDNNIYVGNADDVWVKVHYWGIRQFEPRDNLPGDDREPQICSIGCNFETQRWYGWSHRAAAGYQVGDVVPATFWEGGETYGLVTGQIIRTVDEAKRAAMRFAESVA